MQYLINVLSLSLLCIQVFGFLFNFNQEPPQPPQPYEDKFLNSNCEGYLCPDTMECVGHAKDCPCPFSKSQLKCVLPNNDYICISKPASHDEKLNAIYDDPVKGPKAKNKGLRDCGWVLEAFKDQL
ncbi:LCL2 (YLR104W) [Zygosaccharomyces parabailii]|nr:LCL2 (YLR104W) [Zygosaccharomyces parabailii]CDH10698.1 probable Long chronological lifespan protein 2 [Zygosaccharomyces bailii ISA1307]